MPDWRPNEANASVNGCAGMLNAYCRCWAICGGVSSLCAHAPLAEKAAINAVASRGHQTRVLTRIFHRNPRPYSNSGQMRRHS